ncbi:MAG TPA: hypothetical protein PLD41_07100 [Casimicrobium huifangae]|nr:hypothetical protein [Casimicrobium huifangae]
MSRRSRLRASLRRKLRRPGSANDSSAEPRARGSLLRRAQQWLAARERLLADWIARARVATALAHPSMPARVRRLHGKVTASRLGGAGAIMVLQWWEYESPLKRRLALEAKLRRMFSVVPDTAGA